MDDKNLEIAIQTAIKAGERILEIYEEDDFQTALKEDDTPITRADKSAHELICRELAKTNIPIISEEGHLQSYEERKKWQRFWLVDPLDGTKEFIKKNGEFTVNIALIEDGKAVLGVIYVPVLQELYYGRVGQNSHKAIYEKAQCVSEKILPLAQEEREHLVVVGSRSYQDEKTEQYIRELPQKVELVARGSSLKLCMIAEGAADVYPRFVNLKEWDIAAGVAIVTAAGGTVIDTETQKEIRFNSEKLAAPCFIARAKK